MFFPIRSATSLQNQCKRFVLLQSKGNVCLGILNGRKVHDGSSFILGGMEDYIEMFLEIACLA